MAISSILFQESMRTWMLTIMDYETSIFENEGKVILTNSSLFRSP